MSQSPLEMATECPLGYAEMPRVKGAELVRGEVRPKRVLGGKWQQRQERQAKWAFGKGPQREPSG